MGFEFTIIFSLFTLMSALRKNKPIKFNQQEIIEMKILIRVLRMP